jgi:quinoprotein glucose dehydrogenase
MARDPGEYPLKAAAAWLGAMQLLLALAACSQPAVRVAPAPDREWPVYGGDAGGRRFSPAAQITPQNVSALRVAWRFATGDAASKGAELKHSSFENTPIMAGGRVYVCSPFNEVSALDPATGARLWSFDPHIDPTVHYPNRENCRGVAYWPDPGAAATAPCAARIFMNTNDRRLFALDAATGKVCAGFGENGVVRVDKGVVFNRNGEMQITSPPVVSHGVVVVGSSVADNQRVKEISGAVRAFDARTGAPLWSFDPLASAPASVNAGAANVWAPMSADDARGLVFLPTTSPSPDFWGGMRLGDDGDADSVVALDIRTGRKVWAFKTVHHDVWDYDNPAQPTLGMVAWGGKSQPAVLQPTKQGLLFTLNRETGAPVIPVEERRVPQGAAPGDALSPTQPFPTAPRPLAPSVIRAEDAFGVTPWEKAACRRMIEGARHEGLFTPPSTRGTIIYPFTGGGTNWGGLAFDEGRQVAYVNTSNAMHLLTLIPADRVAALRRAHPDEEISPQTGAPFGMWRTVMKSQLGLPCNRPPWGQLHAIDMRTGAILWETPLGDTGDIAPGSQWLLPHSGSPNIGGPLATASGLVFIGAGLDNHLHAFDAAGGKELWRGRLPGGAQATPMTYVWKGRQYVLIASGRNDMLGSGGGADDQVIAFALPR